MIGQCPLTAHWTLEPHFFEVANLVKVTAMSINEKGVREFLSLHLQATR
jgi:hypothetical protein